MTNEEALEVIKQDIPCEQDFDLIEALTMAIKALETIPKYKDAYGNGWDDGAKATYEHLKMCEEEQDGDLISRQKVLDGLASIAKAKAKSDAQKSLMGRVMFFTEHLPSVKQEPKTGHWEWVQYDYNPKIGNWHCSECRCIVVECVGKEDKGGIPLYKYCPQCGIKMKSQESEDV